MDDLSRENVETGVPTAAPAGGRSGAKRPHLYLYGIVIFFLGVSVGTMLTIFGFHYILFSFAPDPERMTQEISARIQADFQLIPQEGRKIEKILRDFHVQMRSEAVKTFSRLDELKRGLAKEIELLLPEGNARQRWNDNYEEYFPKPPKPPFFGPHGGPGEDGFPGGPGMPPHPLNGQGR